MPLCMFSTISLISSDVSRNHPHHVSRCVTWLLKLRPVVGKTWFRMVKTPTIFHEGVQDIREPHFFIEFLPLCYYPNFFWAHHLVDKASLTGHENPCGKLMNRLFAGRKCGMAGCAVKLVAFSNCILQCLHMRLAPRALWRLKRCFDLHNRGYNLKIGTNLVFYAVEIFYRRFLFIRNYVAFVVCATDANNHPWNHAINQTWCRWHANIGSQTIHSKFLPRYTLYWLQKNRSK